MEFGLRLSNLLPHVRLSEAIALKFRNIRRIPEEHLSNASAVECMDLGENRLLNMTDLRQFVGLKLLSLAACGLSQIPEELRCLTALEVLNLSGNPLTSVSVVGELTSLQILNLSVTGVRALPDLSKLVLLQVLDISGNMLECLSDSVCNLSELMMLFAHKNKLKKLPAEIGKLMKLKFLDLHDNLLAELPPSVGSLVELSHLDLHQNFLAALPECLSKFVKLEYFAIGDNLLGQAQVTCVSTGLPALPTLRLRLDLEEVSNPAGSDQVVRPETLSFRNTVMQMTSLKTLDIRFCGLLSFPDEMMKLKELEVVLASGNRLIKFPKVFLSLRHLKSLEMVSCQIDAIPSDIENLMELVSLNLSKNRLEYLPPTTGKLVKLAHMNVAGNILKSLPNSIGDLSQLVTLDLAGNNLARLPNSIGKLSSLTSLVLSGNKISRLPETIEGLKKLSSLDLSPGVKAPSQINTTQNAFLDILSPNQLASLPDNIGKLTSLSTLNLSYNKLKQLPDSITKLDKLASLDLSQNNLVSLPEGFGELVSLRVVNLSNNASLKRLPASFKSLSSLEELYVSGCRIHAKELQKLVTKELQKLVTNLNMKALDFSFSEAICKVPTTILSWSTLTVLRLQWCSLRGLPKKLNTLSMLEELNISGNRAIASFPAVITELPRLKVLNIACCSLRSIPKSIASLTKLSYLLAGSNCLDHYPEATMELRSLFFLDLSNLVQGCNRNRIEELPKELVNKPKTLQVLFLWGTGTKSPPEEICALGLVAIKQFLKAVELGDERFCAESVSLLGETCAGKSSILLSMKDQTPRVTEREDRTRVVERVVIQLDDRLVTVNDFGGHEIYQTVLPVFLPRKGVAVLAYDVSESWEHQETKVRKWIATIIARSPGMSLIVVGTHADLVEAEKLSEYKQRMEKVVFDMFAQAVGELQAHHSKRSQSVLKNMALSKHSSVLENLESCGSLSSEATATEVAATAMNPHMPDGNFGNGLTEAVQLLETTYRVVITLSCTDASKGDGINRLKDEILKKIQPGIRMPDRWVRFMTELLTAEAPHKRTHLSLDETRTSFARLVDPPDENILLTILRYLVATSRIIWLESHPRLRQCVFHQVSVIQDVCKAILHHDALKVPLVLDDDMRKYRRGQLSQGLYKHFLPAYTDAELVSLRQLLQTFNVICSGMDREGDIMILPSLLPQDDRPRTRSSTGFSSANVSFFPQVCVKMEFLASVIPLAFFETSLASLVDKIVKAGKAKPRCWRNGLSYDVDDLTLCYERNDDSVKVAVAAANEKVTFGALWKELYELLTVVIQHVERMWPGAMPKVRFVCPTLLYAADGPDFSGHGRELPIEEIVRDRQPGGQQKYSCDDCEQSIPRVFCFYCKPEHISEDNEKDALAFLEKMKRQRDGHSEIEKSERDCKLADKFRKERVMLIRRLDDSAISHIIDILFGDGILTNDQKEYIEAKHPVRYDMARGLVDKIDAKGPEAIAAFLSALESDDVGLSDLAQKLRINN